MKTRIRNLIAAWLAWYRFRRSLMPLLEASDRDLKDLGLSRQDLGYLRAGHSIERPPGRVAPPASSSSH
jgi:uncharacterized protein YjiS (DUF1127 family)